MQTPIYTYFRMEAVSEQELRHQIVMLRFTNSRYHFGDNGWVHVRVDHSVMNTEEDAIQLIESRVSDSIHCCAVQYRVTPDSNRLRGAQLKLNALIRQLNGPFNTLRLEKKIVLQREKIVAIRQELAQRSTHTLWLVGGLLVER